MSGGTINGGYATLESAVTIDAAAAPSTISAAGGLTLGGTSGSFYVNRGTAAQDLIISSAISGANALTLSGAGILDLAANTNTYTGPTIISGGTLEISNKNSLGTAPATATPNQLVINGGVLQVMSSVTPLSANIGIGLGPNAVINIASRGAFFVYSGTVANATASPGSLTETGIGLLELFGTNTYSGTTTVSSGTLQSIGSLASPVVVNGGATLTAENSSNNGATLSAPALNFNTGSNLVEKFASSGNSLLSISGSLTLNQGVALAHLPPVRLSPRARPIPWPRSAA